MEGHCCESNMEDDLKVRLQNILYFWLYVENRIELMHYIKIVLLHTHGPGRGGGPINFFNDNYIRK